MSHALLSPSTANIWTVCHPAARLAANFRDRSSSYADEGTVAHRYAELLLAVLFGKMTEEQVKKLLEKEIYKSEYYNLSMRDYVKAYVTYIRKLVKHRHTLFLETKLILSKYIPESFGTGDVAFINGSTLYVVDFKYGQGVEVNVKENKQLLIYALGWLEYLGYLFEIKNVKLIVYQPRLENIDEWDISIEDLEAWAVDELIPNAKKAWEGKGDLVPGKHCRFCRAKKRCKAFANYNMGLDEYELKDPKLLTLKELSLILDQAAIFINWIGEIKSFAEDAAKAGKKIPGYKLVEGKSNRVIGDLDKLIKALKRTGLDESEFFKTDLKSFTDIKALIGVKAFNKFIDPHLIKPKGALALVPEADKRAAFNGNEKALNDFSDLLIK